MRSGVATYLSLPFLLSHAVFVNRTIDDERGDSNSGLPPDFEPRSSWAQGSTCTGCKVQHSRNPPKHDGATINTSLPFDGTWHDSTYHPGQPERTITVKFTGIAVYVFNIVLNSIPSVTTLTNLTFNLDGAHVGNYVHEPDGSSEILYNVPVYTNTTLPHTPHTLVISTGPGLNASLVLFDYIIYTISDESAASSATSENTSPSQRVSTGTGPDQTVDVPPPSVPSQMLTSSSPGKPAFVGGIVGGIIGSIAVVLLILTTTFLLRRCQRRRRRVVPYGANTQGDVLGEACADTLPVHRDDTSTSSLLSPTPAPARDSYPLSEDFTAIAPYSDPKHAVPLAEKIASLSRSSAPVPARTPREVDQMAMEFTFVRASAPPPAHSIDVPDPALSVTGTERSVRHTELTWKIKALEEAVRELHYPGKPGAGASPRPESRGNTRERLHALKEEMARLRVELERERRLMMEAAPRNQRQGKRVLRSVE